MDLVHPEGVLHMTENRLGDLVLNPRSDLALLSDLMFPSGGDAAHAAMRESRATVLRQVGGVATKRNKLLGTMR